MSSFAPMIARGVSRVYARFGEPANYTPKAGDTLPLVVVVERNLTQYGQIAAVQGKTAIVNIMRAALATAPRRGDTFTLAGGEVLTVDSILSSDDIEHKVVAS